MKIPRWPACTAAMISIAILFLPACATIIEGTSQKIPVTSAPVGARVLVDGKDAGRTPLLLSLKKKRPAVIRIEKEGYDPQEIRIIRKKPSPFSLASLGNAAVAFPFGAVLGAELVRVKTDDLGEAIGQGLFQWLLYSALVATAVALPLLLVDYSSGAAYSLDPHSLDVVLKPAGSTPHVDVTEIDEARLRDVKWLRIHAAAPAGRR